MRVFPTLIMMLFCTSMMAAEFSDYDCSDGICQAKVKSGDKTVGLMWGAYVPPKQEFLIATEGEGSGSHYSLLSSDDDKLTVGVIAERAVQPNGKIVRRPQGNMIAFRGSDGTYSFAPHELVGMGKVILKAHPEKPGMFLVNVRLNP